MRVTIALAFPRTGPTGGIDLELRLRLDRREYHSVGSPQAVLYGVLAWLAGRPGRERRVR